MITHFLKFSDVTAAKTALPDYWSVFGNSWDWDRGFVDGPVPVRDNDGTGNPTPGYFLNIALTALNASMPGLTGAGYGPADHFTLVWGTAPITPQRVFA